jgi:hypothetical protein
MAIPSRVPSAPSRLVAVFFDGLALGASARSSVMLKLGVLLLLSLAKLFFLGHVLEHGLGLDHFELGLEVLGECMAGGVASTAGVGHIVAEVFGLITRVAPRGELALH